jgi:tryptophan-rich sensory protein
MSIKNIGSFLIFLSLNFIALALGGLFTADGVSSEWYQTLNKAPWTPPGWVFGAAWTFLMICYAIYLAIVWKQKSLQKKNFALYAMQWILNVSWNPIFFYHHQDILGLINLVLLSAVIIGTAIINLKSFRAATVLILPYIIWLCIATSLNAYITFNN